MATIDERLAFLLQSSESLHASTQELHASMQELRSTVSDLGKTQTETQDLITRLALIAESHENRISDLEEGK